MQLDLPHRPRRRLVSLTPLIDVVFILLLFFMVASRLQHMHALEMQVPPTGAAAHPGATPAVLVRIHPDGTFDLNGMPVTDLSTALAPFLQLDPRPAVVLRPEESVDIQTILHVVDRLAKAGIQGVSLQ